MSKDKYKLNKNGLPNQAFIRDFERDFVDYFFEGREIQIIMGLITGELTIENLRAEVMDAMNEDNNESK